MSIYIGNDLEDRLKALEVENALLTLNRPGGGAESAHRLVLASAMLKR